MEQLSVKWGGSTCSFFTISHGVRQGGILSPKLFSIYMNGLMNNYLCKSYAGCYINEKFINHIMYTDDICLMAPTGSAMQNLFYVCHNYGIANLSVWYIHLKVTHYSVLRV